MARAGFESVGMAGYTSPRTCSKPTTVVRPGGVNLHFPHTGSKRCGAEGRPWLDTMGLVGADRES